MQIRTRLTLQFLSFGAIILLLSFTAIYFFSSDYRKEDFYTRLTNKAINTAKLLIEVEEVDVNLLRRIDKDNPMSLPREKIIIFDQSDSVIYSTHENRILDIELDVLTEVKNSGEVRFRTGQTEILGLLYQDREDTFVVIISATDIYGWKKLKNLLNILLFVSMVSLIILLAIGWFFSGRALKPISNVIAQVDEITISSLDKRVEEGNGQDEIARLAQTFNKMLERLETAFHMQKNFIANASHELRNPLTAILGQLEVLLLKKRRTEEYEQAAISVLEDMKSLMHISNRLLLLAQASTESRKSGFTYIRLDELLWQARDELTKRYPNNKIQILIDPLIDEERKLTILGDLQLTKSAILNLMENGCKFSPDHHVLVEVQNLNKNIMLRFVDHGIGISPEDLDHIFEPFHRGSNVHHIKGHGIGLSLVEKVVKMQNGTITIDSRLNQGTVFTVVFPMTIT